MKSRRIKLLICGLGTILLIGLSGCQVQNISSYYVGLQTNPNESLSLAKEGVRSGQWETFDLLIDYQYQRENHSLKISGDTTFSNYYQMNMGTLRNLELFLFFLDTESKVLETARILRGLGRDLYESRHFEKTLEIPESARAISFGYRGSAREEQWQRIEWFDHLPQHSR